MEIPKASEVTKGAFIAIVENMADCASICTAVRVEHHRIIDFEVEYVNRAACEINRLPREAQVGKRLCELLPLHRRIGLFDRYREVVETGVPFIEKALCIDEAMNDHAGRAVEQRFTQIRAHKFGDGFVVSWRDITRQVRKDQQAERRIAENAFRFKLLTETISDVFWISSPGVREMVYVSPGYETLWESPLDELYENPLRFVERIHPEDQDGYMRYVVSHHANQLDYTCEYRLVSTSGDIRWIRETGYSVSSELYGTPLMTGVCTDITELKKSRMQLGESERRFRAVFENNVAPIVITDNDGNYLDVNPAACALFGYSREQLLRMNVANLDTVAPGAAARAFSDYVSSQQIHGELTFVRPDGDERTALWSAERISDTMHACILRDFTAIRNTRKRLRFQKEQAQKYLDVAAFTMLGLDAEARITLLNPAGCKLLGVAREKDALGRSWLEFIPEKDHATVRQVFTEIMHGDIERYRIAEAGVKTAQGEERTVRWRNAVIQDDEGRITGTLSSGEDVTQQRMMEVQLAQADRLSSMGMLAAGVAHEINNPLSYVLFNLETVMEALPSLMESGAMSPAPMTVVARVGDEDGVASSSGLTAEEAYLMLKRATDGARRIQEISRALGSFSRVDKDQLSPVDITRVLEVAINMAFNEIKYRARLVKDFDQTESVLASEGRLSQVFLNLIINAAHAIEDGDAENNEIRITTRMEGAKVCAEVRDTGHGISSDNLHRLFEPFFTTKEIGVGSGLGLAISKSIVDSYDGTIDVESTAGQGAAFTVRLPVLSDSWVAATASGRGSDSPREQVTGRVLIVDDEDYMQDILSRILSSHETVTVSNGAGAIEILEQDARFDLVISDLMMSNVSGIALHKWLLDHHSRLAEHLIFITGGAFSPQAREYLKEVGNIRLEKPLDIANFKKIVENGIRASRSTPPETLGVSSPV